MAIVINEFEAAPGPTPPPSTAPVNETVSGSGREESNPDEQARQLAREQHRRERVRAH